VITTALAPLSTVEAFAVEPEAVDV